MKRLLLVLLLAIAAFTPAALVAQQQQQAQRAEFPPALSEYKGRRIAQTMSFHGADWLIRTERDKEENTTLLLRSLNLRPGMVVADVGCGNGYYALKMAALVGDEGWVYGTDIQSEMLEMLNERAHAAGVENVSPILGTLIGSRLPAGSCDLILLVDVYHEFSHPEHMLRSMRRALKPTGRLVLAEYREEDPTVPIKPLHKMSKAQIMKELPPNGYKFVEEFDGLPWQHLMFFARDDAPPSP